MTFGQSFIVSHPPEIVWDFFGRIGEVASCLPGAALAGEPVNGHVEGRIKVKVGPISAEFQGVADVTRDDTSRTGQISGAGRDQRSNSATRGLIGYVLKPGANAGETQVDVTIGYTLTGMLAQFGRSGLVQDVANRIIEAFATNLEAKLSGEGENATVANEFDAGSLMSSVILGRIKKIFGGLFGKRRKPGSP
nr:SRPBCC family protein [Mesorhizobium sp. B2-4-9]